MRAILATVICAHLLSSSSVFSAEPAGDDARFADLALRPFWSATQIQDSLFFVKNDPNAPASAKLLYQPRKLDSLANALGDTKYEEGKDYTYDAATGVVRLTEGSRIPFKTLDELYPLMTSDAPKIGRQAGDKTRGIFFDNGAVYEMLQARAVYEVEPGAWKGPVPSFAGDVLPKTLAKLKAKRPVKIFLSGDSISEGYNATEFVKSRPGQPAYGKLVALGLQKHFGAEVAFENFAVAGWNAPRGLQRVRDENLADKKPDLVIIAYGMNDVFGRNAPAYQASIKQIIADFRAKSDETEFILVATMLGNAEWGMPMEQFPLYRDALKELTGPGVALVDMTSIWEEFLKRKSFYDLTGNGVNHPNDLGHAFYAQAVAALLIEPTKP